ncbi:MAG: caspase family protein [Chitinophagaceae bacterium]
MRNPKHPKKVESFSKQKKLFAKKMSQSEEVARTKFILLIAANTIDATIGKGCTADISSMRHMFEKLSQEMNFNFIELIVQGEDYGKDNILGAIDMLTPGNNDIVVFYYSGHGFSYEKDASKKYPQVDLRSHPASDKIDVINAHTENLADLFEIVKRRGARLNIVIGDCCNSLIEFKRKVKGGSAALRKEKQEPVIINKETCEVLFCDYTASILVASAGKGEYAVSDDKLGSLFTYNLSKSLKMLMKKDVDKSAGLPWGTLLEETTDKTLDLSKTYDIGNGVAGNQKAIYNIEFRETLY